MASSTMSSVVFRFTSTDALQIACTLWNGRVPVSGVVQIAHGMGEHIGRYLDLIEVLVSRGFTVYGNDHRGQTGARRPRLHISEILARAVSTCSWRI